MTKSVEIRPGDPQWIENLDRDIKGPPFERLFVRGRPLRQEAAYIAIVGTRKATTAGIQKTEEIATELAEGGAVIVSGLAYGIDAAAHRAALAAGGHTIAVLGTGNDLCYPSKHKNLQERIEAVGTLVSEYPDGTESNSWHFPERNRVIAALSDGVVVIEGGLKSGALITARFGLDFGREVMALPGSTRNPYAKGPHHLIRTSSAALVTCAQDVMETLAPGIVWSAADKATSMHPVLPAGLDEVDGLVLQIMDDVPLPADQLAKTAGRPTGEISMALARLEVRGLADHRFAGFQITRAGARVREALANL
jgi:DNA processing protein